MVRIKAITRNGKEFISPFIYTEGTAKFTIKKLESWHNEPYYGLEHIDFQDCPKDCLYNQHWGLDEIRNNLPLAEKIWMGRGE